MNVLVNRLATLSFEFKQFKRSLFNMRSTQCFQGKIYFKKHIQQLMNLNIQTLRRMWNRGNFPKPLFINGRCAWRSDVIDQYISELGDNHG